MSDLTPHSLARILAALSGLNGPVLDLGCGTGLYARSLARAVEASGRSRVVGLDFDADAVETARALCETELWDIENSKESHDSSDSAPSNLVSWVVGDALSLPFADETFAGVLCVDVLHWSAHAAAFAAAWAEARRVLRPGGVLYARLLLDVRDASDPISDTWYRVEKAWFEAEGYEGCEVALEADSAVDGRAWVTWKKPDSLGL